MVNYRGQTVKKKSNTITITVTPPKPPVNRVPIPNTGDDFNLILYGGLLVLSLFVALYAKKTVRKVG